MKIKGTIAIVIAISLMISAGTLQLLPQTFAHSPAWQIPTYPFLNVAPNPAGLGQTVSVNFWFSCTNTDSKRHLWGQMAKPSRHRY